jgi:uncharacterized protein YdaU (DUF1376 family)
MLQHGAYRLMLDHCYSTEGPLPSELTAIFRICGATTKREKNAVEFVLSTFWKLSSDGYHNSRVDRQLAKQADVKLKLSNSGRCGAERRWKKDGVPQGQPMAHPNSPPHSPAMASHMAKPKPELEKAAASPLWKEVGLDPSRIAGPFRMMAEKQYLTRGSESLSEFMGSVVDAGDALEIPRDGTWCRRLTEIRSSSGTVRAAREVLDLTKVEPW